MSAEREATKAAKPPLSDSPWFWLYLFATAAIVALTVANSKFQDRQAAIERSGQGRQRAAQNLAGETPDVPMSTPQSTRFSLTPLFILLSAALIVGWTALWWRRFRDPPDKHSTTNVNLLANQSFWIIAPLALGAAALASAGWRTGRRSLLAIAVALAAAALGLFVMTFSGQTERDKVEAVIRQGAAAVERNDIEAATALISDNAQSMKTSARALLERYDFNGIDIKRNLEIEVFEEEEPPRAEATFNVSATIGADPQGMLSGRRVPRYVEITFHKEEGAWKIISYAHREPTFGMKKRP